ncbi:MAG: carbonic anhydrase [Magnetococcales bacterium]|nr:carbonic anhydrase [Magnetococcales bacterium]
MTEGRWTRRRVLSGLGLLPLAAASPLALASGEGRSVPRKFVMDQAMRWLREGNRRFVKRTFTHPNATLQRQAELMTEGQHPFVTILSCSDSRVPVELIFDRGLGDLFVVRVAGAVADVDEIATCEYGLGHLETPLLVVLGHTQCGAVTAVVKGDKLGGNLPQLVDNIAPAVERAKARNLEGNDLILEAIKENVRQSLQDVFKGSAEITHRVHQGQAAVVGAVYHLDSGEVEWL